MAANPVKEKLSVFSRKKSRRYTELQKSPTSDADNDECKKFSLLLEKSCLEQRCSAYPQVSNFLLVQSDDGYQPIPLESAIGKASNVSPWVSLYVCYSTDMKLKVITAKTAADNVLIDIRTFLALSQIIPQFSHLITLRLDRCNITSDQIAILADALKSRKSVAELSLIGNPNSSQNFYNLIHCGLKVLVLKFCRINERGLKKIADEYLNLPSQQSTLIHLDLSFNSVFDEGCVHVATVLRCDRTLRSLNLTDCKIREEGLATLFACFIRFPLKDEEISVRRRIRMNYFKLLQKVVSPITDSPKTRLDSVTLKDKLSAAENVLKTHPFTDTRQTTPENGQIFCKGNYVLENLNLSYNHLTKSALERLLKVLMEQGGSPEGLQRVRLEGNLSGSESECEEVKNTIQEVLDNKRLPSRVSSEGNRNRLNLKRRRSSGVDKLATGSRDKQSE